MGSDDDIGDDELWSAMTRDVKPLPKDVPRSDEKPKEKNRPVRLIRRAIQRPSSTVKPVISSPQRSKEIDSRTAQRLKRGQIPVEARLDLHGMQAAKAQTVLRAFLIDAYDSGRRCVLVITGKGLIQFEGERETGTPKPGIIRRSLPDWLSEIPLNGIVLKSQQAQIKDGGAGAFYILLRKRR